MKIYGLYLVDKIITGGNRRYVELLTSLAKKGVDVTVFVNQKLQDEFLPCMLHPIPITLKKGRRISVEMKRRIL